MSYTSIQGACLIGIGHRMIGLAYHIIFIFLNQVKAISAVLWGVPETKEIDFTAFICIKLKSRDSLKILRNAYLARNVFQKQRHSEWSRQRHKLLFTRPLSRRRSSYLYKIFTSTIPASEEGHKVTRLGLLDKVVADHPKVLAVRSQSHWELPAHL